MNNTLKGALIATAVAGMFGCSSSKSAESGTSQPAAGGETVKCASINECKGTGACGGADHDCAGKNECKGKGWIKVSKADCESKGGTVM